MGKTAYLVTDVQGLWPDIAGTIRRVGSTVMLTAVEAEFEIKRKTIIAIDDGAVDIPLEPSAPSADDATQDPRQSYAVGVGTPGQTMFAISPAPTMLNSLMFMINGVAYQGGRYLLVTSTSVTWLGDFALDPSDDVRVTYS